MQKPTLHVLSDEWDRGVRTTRPCRSAARLLFFSREPGACPALTEIRAHDGLIPPGNPPVIKPGNPWSRNKSKRWYQYVHFPSFRYRGNVGGVRTVRPTTRSRRTLPLRDEAYAHSGRSTRADECRRVTVTLSENVGILLTLNTRGRTHWSTEHSLLQSCVSSSPG